MALYMADIAFPPSKTISGKAGCVQVEPLRQDGKFDLPDGALPPVPAEQVSA